MDLTSTVTLNNGVRIPWVGFGVFQVEPGEETYRSAAAALEAGYRAIDTAALYGNEADVGRAVRDSGLPRGEVFVTTKVWNDMHGYEPALQAFEASRKKLDLDPIDLFLIHWPCPSQDRYRDTWKAMVKLYRDGAVRSIGVSNFTVGQLEILMDSSDVVPAVNQVEFHPFLYQAELLDFCREHGILLEAWSPLTRGRNLDNSVIRDIARSHGRSPAQVLIRWCLQHGVIVLPRSTKAEHIRENGRVFDFQLSVQDMALLDGLDEGARIGPDPDSFC